MHCRFFCSQLRGRGMRNAIWISFLIVLPLPPPPPPPPPSVPGTAARLPPGLGSHAQTPLSADCTTQADGRMRRVRRERGKKGHRRASATFRDRSMDGPRAAKLLKKLQSKKLKMPLQCVMYSCGAFPGVVEWALLPYAPLGCPPWSSWRCSLLAPILSSLLSSVQSAS